MQCRSKRLVFCERTVRQLSRRSEPLVRFGDIFGAYVSGRSYDRLRAVSENRVRGNRVRDALKSASVGLLLLSVVASTIAGSETAFFSTVLASWLLFPVLVGFRHTLDAGCVFMLISLGVMIVVGLAQYGPGYLLP